MKGLFTAFKSNRGNTMNLLPVTKSYSGKYKTKEAARPLFAGITGKVNQTLFFSRIN